MDMVMADLERATERAESAEREAERLKQQLQGSGSRPATCDPMKGAGSVDMVTRDNLEIELAAKHKEVSQLVDDVQKLQNSLTKLRESTAAQVSRLEEEVRLKNKALAVLEDKLCSQQDYQDIRRELGILKSLEFAGCVSSEMEQGKGTSLEVLLLEKNKALQSENTQLKVACADLTGPACTQSTLPTSSSSPHSSDPTPSDPTSSNPTSSDPTPIDLTPSDLTPCDLTSSNPTSTDMTSNDPIPSAVTPSDLSSSTVTQNGVTSSDAPTNSTAPSGEEPSPHHHHHRPHSSSRSATPASSSIHSPSTTPTSFNPRNNLTPTSPSPALSAGGFDPRHFPMPPPSPFYGYAGLPPPFHPAFMPLKLVKSEGAVGGGLDTAFVAKTVREQLAMHNIGQRLFAKHVLGLSQGTVSELLSKPKPWDKLTEKGRESYRKMQVWSSDNSSVMALKALSPKKSSVVPPSNPQKDDSVTEERIASILSQAQHAMHAKKMVEQQEVASAVVNSLYQMEMNRMVANSHLLMTSSLSPTSPSLPPRPPNNTNHHHHHPSRKTKQDPDLNRRGGGESEGGENSQALVARIYRQELEKLKEAAESTGNTAASTRYKQELEQLEKQGGGDKQVVPLRQQSNHHHRYNNHHLHNGHVKAEPADSTSDDTTSLTSSGPIDLSKPHPPATPSSSSSPPEGMGGRDWEGEGGPPSAFYPVPPHHPHPSGGDSPYPLTPGPNVANIAPDPLSPLQRMQTIANSLTSQPQAGISGAKGLRCVLPSISQEQFEQFSNLNTEEVVRRVKEALGHYSISQRLFGEHVLGLSQGSVSDLLARPKPWHMLTQKGREPFIRMHMFLNDADAIPKLVSNHYRVPPDKLMRNARFEGAQRRRKSSADERGFDNPLTPKRPRVFFTEEQRERLRRAYQHDPYPNPPTIDSLAHELGVGVKTVVNWFHNHRMRAKQRHQLGASSDGGSDQGNSGGRWEAGEDNSNHSDMSSMSGDAVCQQALAAATAAAFRQVDNCQWMFPRFEPVGNQSKTEEWDRHSGDDQMDETDGPCQQTETKESKVEPVCLSLPPQPPAAPLPLAAVNKRKRSNPQRVCEGERSRPHVLLDRSEVSSEVKVGEVDDGLQQPSSFLLSKSDGLDILPHDSYPRNTSPDTDRLKTEREERIHKLQQGLSECPGWEDEEDNDEEKNEGREKEEWRSVEEKHEAVTSSVSPQPVADVRVDCEEDWQF